MTPTTKLRFVKRQVVFDPAIDHRGTQMILQQWWEDLAWGGPKDMTPPGEWRDVPMETEE